MNVSNFLIWLLSGFIPPALCLVSIAGLLLPAPLALRLARGGLNRQGVRWLGLGLILLAWAAVAYWLLRPEQVSPEFTFLYLLCGGNILLVQVLLYVLATWPPAARKEAVPNRSTKST